MYLLKIIVLIFIVFILHSFNDEVKIIQINEDQFEEVDIKATSMGDWINKEVVFPLNVLVEQDKLIIIEDDFKVDDELLKYFQLRKKRK